LAIAMPCNLRMPDVATLITILQSQQQLIFRQLVSVYQCLCPISTVCAVTAILSSRSKFWLCH